MQMTSSSASRSIWEPMKVDGQFILLMSANAYLSNDFEYSLRVSLRDVSYVAHTRLFESHILRYRALASLKMFEYGYDETEEDRKETFEYLTSAIESIENAYEIYSVKETKRVADKNQYGMGLCNYTKGYIYKNFAAALR